MYGTQATASGAYDRSMRYFLMLVLTVLCVQSLIMLGTKHAYG
jgi:hypothetical protein